MKKNATMAANDNGIDIVETEIARGERDNVFEDYPRLERKKTQNKLCSKISVTKSTKVNEMYFEMSSYGHIM